MVLASTSTTVAPSDDDASPGPGSSLEADLAISSIDDDTQEDHFIFFLYLVRSLETLDSGVHLDSGLQKKRKKEEVCFMWEIAVVVLDSRVQTPDSRVSMEFYCNYSSVQIRPPKQ
jgi:hypothetical protein